MNIHIIARIQKASISVMYESSENSKRHDSHIAIFLGKGHVKSQVRFLSDIWGNCNDAGRYDKILGFGLPKTALMRQVFVIMLWGADANPNCDGHMF